jgi:hypothetical protein
VKSSQNFFEWLSASAWCHSLEISILAFTEILKHFFHFFSASPPGLVKTAAQNAEKALSACSKVTPPDLPGFVTQLMLQIY